MANKSDDAREYLESLLGEIQALTQEVRTLREVVQVNSEVAAENTNSLATTAAILEHLASSPTGPQTPSVEEFLQQGASALLGAQRRRKRR